jgi:ATP-binding cassette subfamily C (CFTR/MRP) protein 4
LLKECDRVAYVQEGSIVQSIVSYDDNSSIKDNFNPIEQIDQYHDQNVALTDEGMASGAISPKVFFGYFRSGTSLFSIVGFFLLMFFSQVVLLLTDFWIALWSNASTLDQKTEKFPLILIILSCLTIIVTCTRSIFFYRICINASKNLFSKMLRSVLSSPMFFFQSNSQGRILNRFSKDIAIIDEDIPPCLFDAISCGFIIIGSIVSTIIVVPIALVCVPFLGAVLFFLRRYYMATCRQVKRYESICRSPVYGSIPSTLEGLTIIRAFGMTDAFLYQFYKLQNEHTRMVVCFWTCVRWLGLRLDLLVALFLGIICFSAVGFRNFLNISSGFIGLVLYYLIALCDLLQWAVRQSAEAESLMVSTERVLDYTKLPSESTSKPKVIPTKSWPQKGGIEISNLSLSYPSFGDVPVTNALKNITISIPGGTKLGICGRTGSGKSSLIHALFRTYEPQGLIEIDGIPISDIDLLTLRSSISIVPQNTFCFKGTIRFNLDPFDISDDDRLWEALDAVGLKETFFLSPEKLHTPVEENGLNFSQGERQLICLARAVLRRTKIIVMDEATSSLDHESDRLIQTVFRKKEFADTTILTIAHRLDTIMDYDKVLILEDGHVKEFGDISDLLLQRSEFARMLEHSGLYKKPEK